MFFRRLLPLLLVLCLLPIAALGEGCVVNLIDDPEADYAFEEGAELFTIVFPPVHGSDCAILLYQDEVMMIDCSTDDQAPLLVVPVLQMLDIDHVDIAFNSHPHDDHLTGFEFITDQASIGKLLVGFDTDYNWVIKRTARVLGNLGVPVERVNDGDVLTLGDGQVSMTVYQRHGGGYTTNDRSATLMIHYGDRTIFFSGDIENRGQKGLLTNPPEESLKTDILKYPHHGHAKVNDALFALFDPELSIVTAHEMPADDAFDYLARMHVPGVSTWYGTLRLRTDGHIWVLDRITEGENQK